MLRIFFLLFLPITFLNAEELITFCGVIYSIDTKEIECTFYEDELDLKTLEGFKKLESLNLSQSKFKNINSISKLKHLKKIDLSYTEIKDIDFLKDLKELNEIILKGIQIENFEVIKNIKNLKYLQIGEGTTFDISYLKMNKKDYYKLNFNDENVQKYYYFSGYNNDFRLNVSSTDDSYLNITNAKLKSIEKLNFENKIIVRMINVFFENYVDVFKETTKIGRLYIANTNIKELDLRGNKKLQMVKILNTQLNNLPLIDSEHLFYFDIIGDSFKSIDNISTIKQIDDLFLCSNEYIDLKPLFSQNNIGRIYINEKLYNKNKKLIEKLNIKVSKTNDVQHRLIVMPDIIDCYYLHDLYESRNANYEPQSCY